MVCDGYVKYEEAEVDGLVAILKTNNCGGGGGLCGKQKEARLGESCLINTVINMIKEALRKRQDYPGVRYVRVALYNNT